MWHFHNFFFTIFSPPSQLPADINVSKEARQAISKAASVFVLYATSCANNFALKGKRKTLAANDIFQAMGDMEFERFVPELKKSWEGKGVFGRLIYARVTLCPNVCG